MALKHLTDKEIQDYLDGNLSQEKNLIVKQHLDFCESCQSEFNEYKNLYAGLKNDADVSLSPNFSKSVISKIQQEAPTTFNIRFRDILLSIMGLLFAVGTTLYYVDFKPVMKSLNKSLKQPIDNSTAIFSSLKQALETLNVDFNLIVFAGLILLIIIAVDHFLYRNKDKLFSFLKTIPNFCFL